MYSTKEIHANVQFSGIIFLVSVFYLTHANYFKFSFHSLHWNNISDLRIPKSVPFGHCGFGL